MPEHERITAGEIRAGDVVGRTRTTTREVREAIPLATAIRIYYVTGGNDRPRQDARWWREVRDA